MHAIDVEPGVVFSSLTFSPDSSLLALVAPHYTTIMDPVGRMRRLSARRGSAGTCYYWGGPRDRILFVSDSGQGLYPLDADTQTELPAVGDWPDGWNVIVTSDGSFVISNEQDEMGGEALSCWRRASDGMTIDWSRLAPEPITHSDRRLAFFLHDGERFVYTEERHSNLRRQAVVLASRTSVATVSEGTFPHSPIRWSAVSSRGDWFGFCQPNGASCYLYRTDDVGLKPVKLTNKNRTHLNSAAFHPSGHILATAGNDGTVSLYDTTSWQVTKTFDWKIGKLRCVAFSPDGALAAVGSDTGKVVVWDVDV